MPTINLLSTGAAGAAAAALGLTVSLSGLAASPADAAATPQPASVTVHVTGADGQPLAGVSFYAQNSRRFVNLGLTDENGNLTEAAGDDDTGYLKSGTWDVSIYDADQTRAADGDRYIGRSLDDVTFAPGDNSLPDVALQLGGSVKGRLVTPSGAPLPYAFLIVLPTDVPDPVDPQFGDGTAEDGTFSYTGLEPGSYKLLYMPRNGGATKPAGFTFTVAPDTRKFATGDLAVKLAPTKKTWTGTSPAKGRATLTFTIAAKDRGVFGPGGSIAVTLGKDKAKGSFEVTNLPDGKGQVVVRLSDLPAGKRTFTAAYSGGDLLDSLTTATVTVR